MENNRAMYEMYLAAKEMLKGKSPLDIAEKANISYDEQKQIFIVSSLGKQYDITYPEYRCNQEIDHWQFLIILHYMNLADGTPLSGKWITLGQMPGGVVRGTLFDRTISAGLCKFLKGKCENTVCTFMDSFGGTLENGPADMTVRLPFLPRFPLILNIWFEDEEFPPSARMLVDEMASHYLTVEDGVTVGDMLLRMLK